MANEINITAGLPVYLSDYSLENTAIIINTKTGVGKIIIYEELMQELREQIAKQQEEIDELTGQLISAEKIIYKI